MNDKYILNPLFSVILGFSGVVDSWNYKLYAIKIDFELDGGQFFVFDVKRINMNKNGKMLYLYDTQISS